MKILIAGDLSLQDRAFRRNWNIEQLSNSFSEVSCILKDSDFSIVNLESPITECSCPILKDGPNLKNSPVLNDILDYLGFKAVSLANNHLKDYGSQGVIDTIDFCLNHGIFYVGAGSNLVEARKPLIVNNNGFLIGFLNVCEHESSIATSSSAGSNPLDISYLYYDIAKLRQQVDKVIVIIHGGREHYQLPTPRMKRDYRLIADFGADVIVNHHQHCFSGYEIYNGKPIFYGLGNFFFDNPRKRNDKWNYGLMLKLNLDNDNTDFELIPYEQCNAEPVISIRDFSIVKDEIESLNTLIADNRKLEDAFEKLVDSTKPLYPFLPYGNHYLRALYNRGYLPDCISLTNKAKIYNAISCETHREVLLSYLKKLLHNE